MSICTVVIQSCICKTLVDDILGPNYLLYLRQECVTLIVKAAKVLVCGPLCELIHNFSLEGPELWFPLQDNNSQIELHVHLNFIIYHIVKIKAG